jgi:hypothetical protein
MVPLFGRFSGTMDLSDSLCPCITVVSVGFTVRTLLRWPRSDTGPPESRTQCFRACQGSATPPGACTPCPSGVPAVAFRVFGARRHPGLARFRGSLPCLYVPLSTLHGPRYRGSRMTRGPRGWLNLRCRRLALLHIVPVCLGTPERRASGAAGSGSEGRADAGSRRLHAMVRLGTPYGAPGGVSLHLPCSRAPGSDTGRASRSQGSPPLDILGGRPAHIP